MPSPSLLQPILDAPLDSSLPVPETIEALSGVKSFASQLKKLVAGLNADSTQDEKVVTSLADLLTAYPRAFYLAAQVVWNGQSEKESENRTHLRQSLAPSLQGMFALYGVLVGLDSDDPKVQSALDDTRMVLLAAPFIPTPKTYPAFNLLAPLLDHARQAVQVLRTSSRPMAHHHKADPRASPLPAAQQPISDDTTLEIMTLLDLFSDGCSYIHSLVGPVLAETKAQKEKGVRRLMRLAMEARMLHGEVALSRANRDIKAIKALAVKKALAEETGDEWERSVSSEAEDEDNEKVRVNVPVEEKDQKPVLDESIIGEVTAGDIAEDEEAAQWEVRAEEALKKCLIAAKGLLEDRRGEVLSDRVEREDWLGKDEPSSKRSPSEDDAGGDGADGDDDSEEDWDKETTFDGADETYPCPLRTLFRLHDRFEEQRLAVWLALPLSSRGGMGNYMRGEEGAIGEAWDALGLLLLLYYDS